ncbi:MAG: hypothetical protein J7K15_12105 [Deltaproteobacteria bacterium]|nr:hypothetical protein [Deltaproteobacteria bacterium]
MKHNYTQSAWEGEKYNGNKWLSSTEIARAIRKDLKKAFPNCKFSVRKADFAGGRSITVSLMAAPFKVIEKVESEYDKTYYQINNYCLDKYLSSDSRLQLTPQAVDLLKKVTDIAQAYNYSNCDSQIDYFDVNFYFHLEIGQWNKPFKEV